MSGPAVVTIRRGVTFTPAAGASFRRAERAWMERGHDPIDVNSTYRDWALQLRMYNNWLAYVAGRAPHPGHSRAVHPRYSRHCTGIALDSDDWRTRGFIAHMAEHGWIRTAANDPTEQHHFEYQWWRDQHRNDPVPSGTETTTPDDDEEEPPVNVKLYLHKPTNKLLLVDHLNMRIRDLGSDNNLERRKFDRLPYITVSGADWTAMFTSWPYVEREKAIRMVEG